MQSKEIIYVSGPITGRPEEEYRMHFEKVEHRLIREGYEVINPVKISDACPKSYTHSQYLKVELPFIETAQAIYMLEGWEKSKGARWELKKAIELNLEIRTEHQDIKNQKEVAITDHSIFLSEWYDEEGKKHIGDRKSE